MASVFQKVGVLAFLLAGVARADFIVRNDGQVFEGKVVSQTEKEFVFIPFEFDDSTAQPVSKSNFKQILLLDEKGAVLPEKSDKSDKQAATKPDARFAPLADPEAPPIAKASADPTYYLIPLKGEVGETIQAGVLEKSLADAVKRNPTVVVLDIDSPGGLVEEAKQIVAVLHKYNKKLRIIALTNQDLSAAAIFTLSCKEIYVRSTSTIGAATSYNSAKLALPAKLEEKMQSAWRAVARNSAQEGGHDALLAEAMIDNDMELHLEQKDGKPVVKEGKGDKMICRKGKILTLTSHEAVACGLANGEADDLDELAKVLKLEKWTEVKGIGTLLAEALPKRLETYNAEVEKIRARFTQNLMAAAKADPSQSTTITHVIPGAPQVPMGPQRVYPGGVYPGGPIMPNVPGIPRPGVPYMPQQPAQVVTERRARPPGQWYPDSVACVVALQKAEGDLADAVALASAYERAADVEVIKSAVDGIAGIRAETFTQRDKYTRDAKPAGTLKTIEAGAKSGPGYMTVGATGNPAFGVATTTTTYKNKEVLNTLDLAFIKPEKALPATTTLTLAKPGYVVGGLIVDAGDDCIFAYKIIFIAFKDNKTDPKDTYTTDWIGKVSDSKPPITLAGKGQTVMGHWGRKTGRLAALGLVVTPPPEQKK